MYFTKVEIENYGCIKNFQYAFRFDQNGNPIPLVLVGQNGTGKTLVLANLVDALIELKRNVYGEYIYETQKNKFFKKGSQSYICTGQSYSRVLVETLKGDRKFKYIDIMSKQPQNDLDAKQIKREEISNYSSFISDGFSKKTEGGLTRKDYKEFVQLYFPSDRYYCPMWYIPSDEKNLKLDYEDDVVHPHSCLIKKNLIQEINAWLRDVYLEKVIQPQLMPNEPSLPENIRGKWVNLHLYTPLQQVINTIFSTVQGVNSSVGDGISRKQKSISTVSKNSCFDISQLSQGEVNLFAVALSIIKEWDLVSDKIALDSITGIVIIDEADLGLHIDYAYRALPALMKLFPKVQFILTVHSPFLLAGLENIFKDNLDIVSMPCGTIIRNITDYFELQKAKEIVDRYSQQGKMEQEQIEELRSLLKGLDNKVNKIFIFTEGETDEMYLKEALKGKSFYSRIDFNPNVDKKDFGDSNLESRYNTLQSISTGNIKICIFDRDNFRYTIKEAYISGSNRTYKFSIPTPSFRSNTDRIAIEHYFTDEEITTADENGNRMFLAKEFDEQGNSIDDQYYCKYPVRVGVADPLHIFDGRDDNTKVYLRKQNKNLALPKKKFAEYVIEKKKGFTFNMDEFSLIADVIENIVNAAESQEDIN